MKLILLINVKMPTIVGILPFISRINGTSASSNLRKILIFQQLSFYVLKFHAMLSWAWNKFYNLGAWTKYHTQIWPLDKTCHPGQNIPYCYPEQNIPSCHAISVTEMAWQLVHKDIQQCMTRVKGNFCINSFPTRMAFAIFYINSFPTSGAFPILVLTLSQLGWLLQFLYQLFSNVVDFCNSCINSFPTRVTSAIII